jgi:hypothetical protein
MNTAIKYEARDSYPANFFRWIQDNKHIYAAFKVRALEMALTGRKRYSARTIVELIRWTTDLKDSELTFKINDHYTPGMARMFMAEYSHKYPDFFELRG